MENKFRRQTPRLAEANLLKGSGRGSSNPSERADQTSVESKIEAIEEQILTHSNLAAHIDVVNVYLTIGKYQLEPISWLRQEGLWRSSDPITMQEMSLRLPQREHYEALRDVQPSLFDSPPSDLFDLICQYRWFTDFQETDIIAKLEESVTTSEQRPASRYEAGRTAPDGYKYPCPSRGCRKDYSKSGHLRNHINSNHPDFLRLHPEWKPYYRPVDTGSSDSSSPSSERHPTQRPEEKQYRTRRPISADWIYSNSETTDVPPGSPMAVEVPDDFEAVTLPRSDRNMFLNIPQYRERGSQGQRSRQTSFSTDVRRSHRGFGVIDGNQEPSNREENNKVRAARRHSSRLPPQFSKEQQHGSERS